MPFFPSGIGIEPQGLEDVLSLPPIIPLPLSFLFAVQKDSVLSRGTQETWMPLLVFFWPAGLRTPHIASQA